MRRGAFCVLVMVVVCSGCLEAGVSGPGVGLTIYNDNFAVVREARQMEFEKGQNTVRFTDVASAIDPTSVSLRAYLRRGLCRFLSRIMNTTL